jgi:hypothetical protein
MKLGQKEPIKTEPWTGGAVHGVDGTKVQVEGKVSLPVEIGGTVVESQLAITKELPTSMILGNDTLSTSKVTIDYQERVLRAKRSIPFQIVIRKAKEKRVVRAVEKQWISVRTVMYIRAEAKIFPQQRRE